MFLAKGVLIIELKDLTSNRIYEICYLILMDVIDFWKIFEIVRLLL
jgi:hypothetical protein